MKSVVIRMNNKNMKIFEEAPMYDESKVNQTCIVRIDGGWRFCDIPSGCYFGTKFKTLKEAREFRASTKYQIEYMTKIEELRVKSFHYSLLVQDRNDYMRRMKK